MLLSIYTRGLCSWRVAGGCRTSWDNLFTRDSLLTRSKLCLCPTVDARCSPRFVAQIFEEGLGRRSPRKVETLGGRGGAEARPCRQVPLSGRRAARPRAPLMAAGGTAAPRQHLPPPGSEAGGQRRGACCLSAAPELSRRSRGVRQP